MPQVLKMASVIGEINTALDVYEGMYARKEDAEIIIRPFPEIGSSIKRALTTHIIIGCAALFSDPDKTGSNENMSLKNLVSKYEQSFKSDTLTLYQEIETLLSDMNLKIFRNKHIGHFDLEACLGNVQIPRDITVDLVRELLAKSATFINLVIRDANLMENGHSLSYSPSIPNSRGTNEFLGRLRTNA